MKKMQRITYRDNRGVYAHFREYKSLIELANAIEQRTAECRIDRDSLSMRNTQINYDKLYTVEVIRVEFGDDFEDFAYAEPPRKQVNGRMEYTKCPVCYDKEKYNLDNN